MIATIRTTILAYTMTHHTGRLDLWILLLKPILSTTTTTFVPCFASLLIQVINHACTNLLEQS